ncbi:CcmD family protein [Bacillus sp. Marseille-P3661]|nr:CcmD family protein [Bacillus sp. Marseille-P3661]
MGYLFAAYTIIWALIALYMVVLGKRQNTVLKEIEFVKEIEKTNL